MSDVFFSTNPAEIGRVEELIISERNPPGFIVGANLGIVGFVGKTVKGPTAPQTITSSARFVEVYGERDFGSGGALIGEIWKALINKPFGTIAVARVVASDAVVASFNMETAIDGAGTEVVTISAASGTGLPSPGLHGNSILWKVEDATSGVATEWNLVVSQLGKVTTFENLSNEAGDVQADLDAIIGTDLATPIELTRLATGRPINNADVTEGTFVALRDADDFVPLADAAYAAAWIDVLGTEGTLAASDYTAQLTVMANFDGPSIVLVPESLEDTVAPAAQATLNGQIVTESALSSDRIFLTWSGISAQAVATEIASQVSDITTKSDRIVWCFNSANTLDPEIGAQVNQGPHVWMASVLSQNDVDIHPGSQQTAQQNAGIRNLDNEALTRGDLIALRDAGISTLEKSHGNFLFRSGVTTLLTTGLTEITRRRSTDFLQLSAADRLRFFVKLKNTVETRTQMVAELIAFSEQLRDSGRIIEEFAVDTDSVNTAAQRAQGIEKILWRVKLIGHILFLVLETEIGVTVTITEAN